MTNPNRNTKLNLSFETPERQTYKVEIDLAESLGNIEENFIRQYKASSNPAKDIVAFMALKALLDIAIRQKIEAWMIPIIVSREEASSNKEWTIRENMELIAANVPKMRLQAGQLVLEYFKEDLDHEPIRSYLVGEE